MFEGQVTVGGCVSLTVTLNEQFAVFPATSVAVQLTGVVPFAKVVPDGGMQTTVTVPGQVSVAVTLYVTTAVHWFGSVLTVMFPGQVIVGGFGSTVVVAVPVLFPGVGSGIVLAAVAELLITVP
jgi:hypothetical protein